MPQMDPAPVLAPEIAKNADAPSARKVAASVARWAMQSGPRAASAQRLQTSSAAGFKWGVPTTV